MQQGHALAGPGLLWGPRAAGRRGRHQSMGQRLMVLASQTAAQAPSFQKLWLQRRGSTRRRCSATTRPCTGWTRTPLRWAGRPPARTTSSAWATRSSRRCSTGARWHAGALCKRISPCILRVAARQVLPGMPGPRTYQATQLARHFKPYPEGSPTSLLQLCSAQA